MRKGNIKTVLFGYDRKTVDNFLRKLHRLQEQELQELRSKVASAQNEHEHLFGKLQSLEKNRMDGPAEDAPNVVDETAKLSQSAEDRNNEPAGKAIDFYSAAAKRARKKAALHENIPRPPSVGTVKAEANTEMVDGDSIDQVITENPPVKLAEVPFEAKGQNDGSKSTNEYHLVPKKLNRGSRLMGNGFWDDVEAFIEPIDGELLFPLYAQAAATASPDVRGKTGSFSASPESVSIKEESLMSPPPVDLGTEEGKDEFSSETERVSSPNLDALKRSYIVGKLAGEDLLDRRGHVLVAKYTVITEQLVKLAEREGKLAELIVNMIISGMED